MDIEAKSLMDLAGWLVSLGVSVGGTVAWVRGKLNSHDKRLTDIEKRFVGENNEPALLTKIAHDESCEQKDKLILKEFSHVAATLAAHSQAVKDCSDQMAALTIVVTRLEEKVEK